MVDHLAKQKTSGIEEGHLVSDHLQMIAIAAQQAEQERKAGDTATIHVHVVVRRHK
jgi:hypothetical protein